VGALDEQDGPAPQGRSALLSSAHLRESVLEMLESQSSIEELVENRFLAAERHLAFLVLFHAMASRVAAFWPLRFDVSRSQSCLRVATTAAPVSAADLLRSWEEGRECGLDDASDQEGAGRF
jgi:hypothetical protein